MAETTPGFCFVPIRLDDTELPLFAEGRVFLDFGAYPDGPNGGSCCACCMPSSGSH